MFDATQSTKHVWTRVLIAAAVLFCTMQVSGLAVDRLGGSLLSPLGSAWALLMSLGAGLLWVFLTQRRDAMLLATLEPPKRVVAPPADSATETNAALAEDAGGVPQLAPARRATPSDVTTHAPSRDAGPQVPETRRPTPRGAAVGAPVGAQTRAAMTPALRRGADGDASEFAASLAQQWARSLRTDDAPLASLVDALSHASEAGEWGIESMRTRLGVLIELFDASPLVVDEPTGLRSLTGALERGAEAQGCSLRVVVDEDTADMWLFPGATVRRVLTLLVGAFTEHDHSAQLELLVGRQGSPVDDRQLYFELRDASTSSPASEYAFELAALDVRVSAWLVERMGGRIDLPVHPDGARAVRVSVPARSALEVSSRGRGGRGRRRADRRSERATHAEPWISEEPAARLRAGAAPGGRRRSDDDVSAALEALAAETDRARASRAAARLAEEEGAAGRVLVVDADAMTRWSLTGSLAAFGYVADSAACGDTAFASLQRRSYDAVILDVELPDAAAYGVAARVRAAEGSVGAVPVLGLTASMNDATEERCRVAGMDACMDKASTGSVLARRLGELISGGTGEREAADDGAAGVLVDLSALQGLSQLGDASARPSLASRLVRSFEEKAWVAFDCMREAEEDREGPELERLADRLAASCSVVGADGLAELARAVGRASQTDDAERTRAAMATLERALPEVCEKLRNHVDVG